MTDYYNILGVAENASPDEIKRAYRKLANQHHPDKGGDQAKFKDISVAYDILGNDQKKADYDQQRQFGNGQQFHFHTGNGGFDPFGGMFGGGANPFGDIFSHMNRGGIRRNRDLNIQCTVSLIESFSGKQLEANYQLPSGRNQNVVINVPPGVNHGDTIRYSGLGDDSFPGAPRGNLNVTILVQPDPVYSRRGDDLYIVINITPIEAMIGCKKSIRTLTGVSMDLDIRPGVESGVEFASSGHGFPNVNNPSIKGRFVSVVNIKTPIVTDPLLVAELRRLNDAISQRV
jgi:curved DNA-binding protein